MKCPNCGAEVTGNDRFCMGCGAELTRATAVTGEVAVQDPGKIFGLLSLIFGIAGFFGTPMAIAAMILGSIGKKKSAEVGLENSKAKIGSVLGLISVILTVLAIVAWIVLYVLWFLLIIGASM